MTRWRRCRQVAAERIAAGQAELELGLGASAGTGPLEIVGSKAGHLWDALCRAYDSLGFDHASGGDEVFRALVLARIIEPTCKLDSLRVLDEAGVEAPSYRTLTRRLPSYGKPLWRKDISAACAITPRSARRAWCSTTSARSTSKPTTGTGSGSRVLQGTPAGAADHHRPAHGLSGFRLAVEAFEGNKAERATTVPR